MKKLITLSIICLASIVSAQVPAGYKVVVIATNETLGNLLTPNVTASQIVASGGLTNVSTVGTPTSVVNLPTNNITKSVINTWPIGEGAMTLTNNTFLTFSGFATNDAGSWAMSITGTNTVTVDPTIIDGWGALVWTNSLTVPNDLFFRKTSGSMLIRVR
jgi:hypothetical protein